MDVRAVCASLESFLDARNGQPADATTLTVRSFELVSQYGAGLPGPEKAKVWGELARRIHWQIPGWNASGPLPLGDGAVAYWGGIPKGYVVIFRSDGDVFFTTSRTRPSRAWIPDYSALQTMAAYLASHADGARSRA